MKRKATFQYTVCIVVLIGIFVFLAGCGSDSAAPSDPSTTSEIPDIVFFNTVDPSAVVRFEGSAFDNFRVQTVELSFNGAGWNTADLDPPGGDNEVEWSYLASIGDISADINTIVIRAMDSSGNISVSDPIIVERQKGSTIDSLLAVFTGPSAASSGDVIGLSSGIGGAYGDGLNPLTIPITTSLTVIGSGYGDMLTSGGLSPVGNSVATILDAGQASPSLFSVDADLTLRSMRLVGGVHGIHLSDNGGTDPQLSVQDCLFDRQSAWAVFAVGDGGADSVQIMSSVVDAYSATNSTRGGLYLENVNYLVEDSEFYFQTDPDGLGGSTVQGAAVLAVGGTGKITQSYFSKNSLSIWANGGSPVISSNDIVGLASSTNGIDISGSGGTPLVNYNTLAEHSGVALRVRGAMTPKFYWNTVSIDPLTYPQAMGILVLDPDSLPEFGKFPYRDSGCNSFESQETPVDGDYVLEVDSTTSSADVFYAGQNYWGDQFSTGSLVYRYKIHDGTDLDNASADIVDLTGTPGGTNPIIWDGKRACP